jgi:hypothetical protein
MNKTLRNSYISYLKGFAILAVIYIHLIDWSNVVLDKPSVFIKEQLYIAVFIFVALMGSLVYLAYGRRDLVTATKRLAYRGFQLIGIYYGYSLAKLWLFDFSQEPFYGQFESRHIFDAAHILRLETFSAPVSILFTLGCFLLLSPLLVWAQKKIAYPGLWLAIFIGMLLAANYSHIWPSSPLTDFLLAKNNITFPLLLWLPVFLMGYLLAMIGIEKKWPVGLLAFGSIALYWGYHLAHTGHSYLPRDYMYPLSMYYIIYSLAALYLLTGVFNVWEKWGGKTARAMLDFLRIIGDHTLEVYVLHIVLLDLTLLLAYPYAKWIWLTVPLGLLIYLRYGDRLRQLLLSKHTVNVPAHNNQAA